MYNKKKEEKEQENVKEGVYQIGADQAISVTCSSFYCRWEKGQREKKEKEKMTSM